MMVGEAGIEPTTPGLEGRCSIQLSYSPAGVYLVMVGIAALFYCNQCDVFGR